MTSSTAKYVSLVIVVGVVLIAGIFVLSDGEYSAIPGSPPVVEHAVIEQEQQDRIWVDQTFEPVALREPLQESLIYPLILKLYDENLYVADHGDMKVKRFSLDGKLLNVIGEGIGEGPGEFGNITDFYVRDEEIWVVSMRTRSISKFSIDGAFRSRFTVSPAALRITGLGENLVLMMMGSSELFHEVDTTGQVLKTFGGLVTEQTGNFLALQGNILTTEQGGFIYVPHYAGYLYYFDRQGALAKVLQTVDRLPFPGIESKKTDTGFAFRAPDVDIITTAGNISDGILYVHVYFKGKTREEGFSILDRYDSKKGTYISSSRLPFPVIDAQVYKKKLYCLSDTTVTVFRLEESHRER